MDKKIPEVRVIKKTFYGNLAQKGDERFEVQYYSEVSKRWRTYQQYGSNLVFKDKNNAIEFAMRKKAGAPTNNWIVEVIA